MTIHEQTLIAEEKLNTIMTQRYVYSSHDKEQDGTQTNWSYHDQVMAFVKSWYVIYEMCFALSFYNALYWLQIIVCAIMSGFKTQSHL